MAETASPPPKIVKMGAIQTKRNGNIVQNRVIMMFQQQDMETPHNERKKTGFRPILKSSQYC